jgi:hypothetical protein
LEQGRSLDEKIVGRLPSDESEQFGSGMVQALKRAIELSRGRPWQLDELQELKKLDKLSAEVEIGELQTASVAASSSTQSQSTVKCDEAAGLVASNEECQSSD